MSATRFDLDAAMRRQLARFHAALAAGMPRAGWKICVNDPRAQARLGIDGPFVGWLNGGHVVASGARYAIPVGARLACEPEIAIRVGRTGNVASLAPVFEVVDYAGVALTAESIVASASFHHGVVLGETRAPAAAPVLTPDCPRLTRNGTRTADCDPSLVPADLAAVVAHVTACLARYGEALRTGDWILSGACAPAVVVAAGDKVAADFGPLGTVRVTFPREASPSGADS